MISETDEQPHAPATSEYAQESWYFNWTDAGSDRFGLARLGYHYSTHRPEPLILTVGPDDLELVYTPEQVPEEMPAWSSLDAQRGLVAGSMLARMEEPLKCWRLLLEGSNRMDLRFQAYTPAFDYTHSEGRLAPSMTTAHFEQSCRVTGWTEFRGRRIEVDGLGQRDKSWGVRVWPKIEGWDWISAQFGLDLSFNVMRALERGEVFLNGFVFREGRNVAVREAELRYAWGAYENQPGTLELRILDAEGGEHRIEARARGVFPIPKPPVQLEEAYCAFLYHGPGGHGRTGAGVVEHVWRPGSPHSPVV